MVVLIPAKGFSEYDKPGGRLYQPEERKAFIEALKRHIEPKIKVIELELHINDPAFAQEAVTMFDSMMKQGEAGHSSPRPGRQDNSFSCPC
jgi:uncharacterized protein (UPF0261 family)